MSAPRHPRVVHSAQTTSSPLRAVGVALATILTVAGCGNQASDSTGPASRSSAPSSAPTPSNPTSSAPAGQAPTEAKEQVTTAGIAALVTEHLGAGKVAAFGSYGDEPGTVDVMIRLRGGGRADNFIVTVYSPKRGGGEFKELTKCPRGKHAKRDKSTKRFTCHRLANGTTVTAYLVPYGFSDDNSRGHVVTGLAGAPDGSVAMALYESYDRSAPITVADVDKLLSDPRLIWMTDPAVNAAGKGLHVPRLRG
jgi:hypothetical protein